jgi:SOS response associated peptidase (SRAP)
MFREAYAFRRCIVPVDGFFEWRAIKGARGKQPYAIAMKDGSPFGLAGLWENWRDPNRPLGSQSRGLSLSGGIVAPPFLFPSLYFDAPFHQVLAYPDRGLFIPARSLPKKTPAGMIPDRGWLLLRG